MAKRMLVDATHPEETRVVVVNGNRLEELDFETAAKRQLKGNIYLSKVTRVEPSLQAAFVEYGGNRHGFLAFSEIHPDYYRIPVADRQALVAQEAAAAAEAGDLEDRVDDDGDAESGDGNGNGNDGGNGGSEDGNGGGRGRRGRNRRNRNRPADAEGGNAVSGDVEQVGGNETEDVPEHRPRGKPLRHYKIQEVIKRRQIMLVQVTKEERGTKGAALTTYLSLAGRYCVLMPNTPRGGGVSRKIANPKDRKRMKAILEDLYIPDGMAVILRTAGLERTKAEIKRDLDYLLRLWDQIRAVTLESTAPTLIHEEANLIKRAIRDLYTRDIDEILVSGEDGYRIAKDFMRMLMPSHAKKVQLYRDEEIPLFHRYQVESQIDAMHSQTVQLRSGGYIVINPTEALVAIDVNSGRSTRERNIEETAYKTNLEAAEEVARQLRLRDLAGLIVIDFIDMEDDRHNQAVERRLKESMKIDRARIQLGRISPFGLLELSRQRLRPSLVETNFETCRHCTGTGLVRTTGSAALHVLRAIEEEGIRKRAREILVHAPTPIALVILNQKRDSLAEIESRYGFRVFVEADDTLIAPDYRMERLKARGDEDDRVGIDTARVMAETDAALAAEARTGAAEAEDEEEAVEGRPEVRPAEAAEEGRAKRRRPRRRRKGEPAEETAREAVPRQPDLEEAEEAEEESEPLEGAAGAAETAGEEGGDRPRKKRRRGKRGGRRRARPDGEAEGTETEIEATAGDRLPAEEADARDHDIRDEDDRDAAWPEPASEQPPEQLGIPEPSEEPAQPEAGDEPAPSGGPEGVAAPAPALEPEVVTEADAEAPPAKPKRKRTPAGGGSRAATKAEAKPRRSRKKAEERAPTEVAAQAAVDTPAEAPAAESDAKAKAEPRPKRAPRSRKKAAPTVEETAAAPEPADSPAAEATEAKPKRKRATRDRKKTAETEATAIEAVAGSPTSETVETAAATAGSARQQAADEASPAPESTPQRQAGDPAGRDDAASEGGHTTVIEVTERPTKEKEKPKRGWWRRVVDR